MMLPKQYVHMQKSEIRPNQCKNYFARTKEFFKKSKQFRSLNMKPKTQAVPQMVQGLLLKLLSCSGVHPNEGEK